MSEKIVVILLVIGGIVIFEFKNWRKLTYSKLLPLMILLSLSIYLSILFGFNLEGFNLNDLFGLAFQKLTTSLTDYFQSGNS